MRRNHKSAVQPATPAARLSSVIKSSRDIMRKDAGLNGDLDRIQEISRSAQAGFNKCDLAGVKHPLPPIDDQRWIVEYLDELAGQVAALARLQSETASALDALLPSILDKAFKGEL